MAASVTVRKNVVTVSKAGQRGPEGATGPAGPAGAPGPTGADGIVTNDNVNVAIAEDAEATRSALGVDELLAEKLALAGGRLTGLLEMLTASPAGGIFQTLLGEGLSDTTTDFNWSVCSFPGVNLPDDARQNTVVSWGFNVDAVGSRKDKTKAAFRMAIEEHYLQNNGEGVPKGPPAFEAHIECIDLSDQVHRMFSCYAPKNGGTGSSANLTGDKIVFIGYDGQTQMDFDRPSGNIAFPYQHYKFVIRNNVTPVAQWNALNDALLALPYIGADNRLKLSQPTDIAGDLITSGTARIQGRYTGDIKTLATLPTDAAKGSMIYVDDGLKDGEAFGLGSGIPAWWDGYSWRDVFSDIVDDGWTPADLFTAEQGYLIDAGNAAARFSDASATAPAELGDLARVIADLSPNGNDWTAPSDAARATVARLGGNVCFDFGGAATYATPSMDFTGTNKITIITAFRARAGAVMILGELSTNSNSAAGSYATTTDNGNYTSVARGNLAIGGRYSGGLSTTDSFVCMSEFDLSETVLANQVVGYVNGTDIFSLALGSAVSDGTGNFGTYVEYIGARAGSAYFLDGVIFARLVIGRLLTDPEKAKALAWLNARARAFT